MKRLNDIDKKKYYIKNTIKNSWNRNVLMHHIKTDLYKRDKLDEKSNNFEVSLPNKLSQLAQDIVKSEYNLEFNNKNQIVYDIKSILKDSDGRL